VNRPELSAEDILAVPNRHGVDYVVIGAFAAIAQGAPLEATHDVDVTPRRDKDNLQRLSEALQELDAGIRVDDLDEGLPFAHDAASLATMAMLNPTCEAGDFNIVFSEKILEILTAALMRGASGPKGPSAPQSD